MKTSHAWLQQYIDITWNPAELAEALTMAGLEVEEQFTINDLPQDVVVAEILTRGPHPNADKLSICTVDDGSGAPLQIVCGAPNCDAGNKAVLARLGVSLPNGLTLKPTKIRGEESHGMLCAKDELGLGDDHTGIITLTSDAPNGTPYAELIGRDTVTDWEITPNRPDWLSHYGIARELRALTGNDLRLPEIKLNEGDKPVTDAAKIIVEAPDLCPRYIARVIENVTIAPSPDWLKARLNAVGIRAINNVVDITNFVMYELGQPLHAFDYDQLADHTIVVRRAKDQEPMTTLDGGEHTLTPDNLLIADAKRGVALAGIMGGENSEISATTTTVLLESAAFDPVCTRATRKQVGLSSDSSYRFERGVDIEMTETASARAAQLICDLAGGTLLAGSIDVRAHAYQPPRVHCRFDRVNRLLGIVVPPAEIASIFQRLGLDVEELTDDGCVALIPPFRLDLTREADLIEEIARVHGLDKIPAAVPTGTLGGVRTDDAYYPLQEIRDQLLALGLDECITNTFTAPATAIRGTGVAEEDLHTVDNPISPLFTVMRPSLLPDMLNIIGRNVSHHNHDLALFEIGTIYTKSADHPEERRQAVIAITGRRQPGRYSQELDELNDFYDLRGVLDGLLSARRLTPVEVQRTTHPAFVEGQTAQLLVRKKPIAVFGKVSDELTEPLRLKYPLYIALVEIQELMNMKSSTAKSKPLSQYPSTTRDIAFLADESLSHEDVVRAISRLKVKNLDGIALFDIFRDEKALGPDKKSMAYSLTFRNDDRTLTDKEVNKAYDQLRKRLPEKIPVDMR